MTSVAPECKYSSLNFHKRDIVTKAAELRQTSARTKPFVSTFYFPLPLSPLRLPRKSTVFPRKGFSLDRILGKEEIDADVFPWETWDQLAEGIKKKVARY